MDTEHIAYRMFARNAGQYVDPAMIEPAWVDPNVRGFWIAEAEAVQADIFARFRVPRQLIASRERDVGQRSRRLEHDPVSPCVATGCAGAFWGEFLPD